MSTQHRVRFRLAAERVHATGYPRWRSQKHADDWWATLERHAFPELGDLPSIAWTVSPY